MGGMVDSKKDVLLGAERLVDVLLRQHEVLIRVTVEDTMTTGKTENKDSKIPGKANIYSMRPLTRKEIVMDPSKYEGLLKLYLKYYNFCQRREIAIKDSDQQDFRSFDWKVELTLNEINTFVWENKITDEEKRKCTEDAIEKYRTLNPDWRNA